MRHSIKAKIILGLLVVISLSMAGIFTSTVYDVSKESREAFLESTVKELRQVDNSLSLFFDESKRNAVMLSLHPRIAKVDESLTTYKDRKETTKTKPAYGDYHGEAITKTLQMMQKSHTNYLAVYFGSKWGGFLIADQIDLPGGYDPSQRPWYSDAVSNSSGAVVSKAYKSSTGDPTISISKASLVKGEVRGVVGMDVSLGQLTTMAKEVKLGKNGFVVLLQDDGLVIANPSDENTIFKNVSELENKAYAQLFGMESGSKEIGLNGVQYSATVYTSPELGWKFIGFVEEAEIMAPVYGIMTELAIIFGISLVVICIFVWLVADRQIVRPMKRINDFLGVIGSGDYTKRLDVDRVDEIGQIYDSLNTMSGQLADNMEEITHKTQDAEEKAAHAEEATKQAEEALVQAKNARAQGMLDAAGRLEEVVDGLSEATDEISGKADEIRQGTDVQRDRLAATATAMEEMNATVLEVAQNASRAADQGMQARDKAQQGAGVVEESITAMDTTQKQAEALNADMAQLDTQAQAIGNIMNVIEDIADQTNLLALNAAIEAARAGEAGRGFAVVADEVRKLAEKTMQATKEVGDSIVAIQRVAAGNVEAMQAAVKDLEQATTLANESGQALAEIVAGTEESAGQIQSIATAAEQQSATSEEITGAIDEINSIAMETASSVEDTTIALEHLVEQSGRLAELIQALKDEAEQ